MWQESRLLVRDPDFRADGAGAGDGLYYSAGEGRRHFDVALLHDGERIFVNKLVYYDDYKWAPHIYRGDIVVFWFPDDPSKSYIKRVIGLPGDTVEMHEGHVRVNGRDLDEGYLDPHLNMNPYNRQPTYVKPGYYFVMGDNRD